MYWDRVAKLYDFFEGLSNKRVYEGTGKRVAREIEAGDTVLECACGTGAISKYIAPACKHLTATDFSKNMLEQTRKKCEGFGNVTVETVTQLAFYCGWPKAWSTFPLVQEVYGDEESSIEGVPSNLSIFPVGEPNTAFAKYFTGKSYLAPLSTEQVPIFNVTFEPGCRNNWHIHHAASGGGQMLVCVSGRGWYQEWGKEPRALQPGDVVNIPEGAKHWHGAAKDSWFQHLAIEVPGEDSKAEWLEPVDDERYGKLEG